MDEPLLSSLCTICHIDVPKYTCPRCSVQTCSLACSRRHKVWSSCNGVRDPTVFVPRSQLATPSGIDHDYNFLHSIEHRIERSEKEIIEDRRLLKRKDLEDARNGEWEYAENGRPRPERKGPGEESIAAVLRMKAIKIHKAPKGMRRNVENTTSWSKNNKEINWQVEWMRNGGTERVLGKILGNKSIGWHYDQWHEEERRLKMSEEERRAEKRRKGNHHKHIKKLRQEEDLNCHANLTAPILLQDSETRAWNNDAKSRPSNIALPFSAETYKRENDHQLYLLRPLTSSTYGKVLSPIDTKKSLTDILQKRDVLEFPTIYVFETPVQKLPDRYMLEDDYLTATGQSNADTSDDSSDSSSEDSSVKGDSSDTDSDEDMEDGEVAV